jgi:hypothetical protein
MEEHWRHRRRVESWFEGEFSTLQKDPDKTTMTV